MEYTIYIVEDESDTIWVEDNFGHDAGVSCRIAAHNHGYGNIGIRVYDGKYCGHASLSYYLFDERYKNSEFVDVKYAISSGLENECVFECDMSDLVEA